MTNPFKRKPREVHNHFEVAIPARLQPGDTLVVQCERRVPRDVFLKLKQQLQEKFGGGVSVIVLEAGLHVEAVIEAARYDDAIEFDEALRAANA